MTDRVFKLTKPCFNCPFLKVGAIELRPGRLAGIIEDIEQCANFLCHKTAHGRGAGTVEDDTGEEYYLGNGKEQPCAGAIIFFQKRGEPTQLVQVMDRMGVFPEAEFMRHADMVIDP